jgi:hypothetical protein
MAGRLYVNRGALRAEASRIERVRATFEGRPVVREASALRDAVASLFADRVVSIGRTSLTAPDLVIEVALAEGGPTRRIACRPDAALAEHVCMTTGVDATFALANARLSLFLNAPADAGADCGSMVIARDGGAR